MKKNKKISLKKRKLLEEFKFQKKLQQIREKIINDAWYEFYASGRHCQ